jgi:hypothetical protein
MEKLNLQGDSMEGVRVIDVAQNCIAVLPHDSEYLAHPYVWGEAEYSREDFQMPHCNVTLLEKPESLTRIPHHLRRLRDLYTTGLPVSLD